MSLNISWKIYFLLNIPWSRFGYSNFSYSRQLFFNPKIKMTDNKTKEQFISFFDSLEHYDIYIFFTGKKKETI